MSGGRCIENAPSILYFIGPIIFFVVVDFILFFIVKRFLNKNNFSK
jgi:uncharacterized membrane protein YqiK